tara:strand:- start:288 stop:497 length:210 start_codon:yes stop_codon:yes gene_type:complete
MKDYNLTVKVRCESKPQQWLVDCIYDELNTRINEDILYWDVKEIEENKEPTPPNPPEKGNNLKPDFKKK